MTAVATPDAARLVFAAVAGLILLLILIIKFKVHAMISILIGAVGIGLMAGMPLSDIIGSVNEGIGNTLKGIALLVGLGSMFGAILEESGGAQTLAVTMVRKFGDEKAAWALGITGLVVAMPVFFDAGLIILIPLAFSLAKRTKRSVLYYVIPLLAGLAVGHAFIPPTPGPVLVATMLGVDLGWVILIGIAVVFVAYNFIGQYFFVTKPDYNVAVVAPYYLPEDTVNALQEALADYGEDRNGDGKVVVKLNVYTMNFGSDDSDAYLDMAGTTKLSTDIQGVLSSIFILYDPAGFQSTTGTLRYLDGSLPAADSDEDWWNMVYKWDDCPVLAGLDLGDYGPDTTQSRSGSSQEYMSQFYVGMRGAWNSGTADNLAGGEELWQKLTAGAVSTVAPEG